MPTTPQTSTCYEVESRQIDVHRAAMDAAVDGMAILNERDEYVYLNRAHVEIYGYKRREELLGRTWRELYDYQQIIRFEQEIFPILLRKGWWRGEAIGRRRDGSTFLQDISLTKVDATTLICVVRDITEHKRMETEQHRTEQALRLSRSRSETLLLLSQMSECWSEQHIIEFTAKEAARLAESTVGYIGVLDEEERLLRMTFWPAVPDVDAISDIRVSEMGMPGEAVRFRRPCMHNQIALDMQSFCGYRFTRHLGVPSLYDGRVVAVVGVGNKEDIYSDEDITQLSLLVEGMWQIIKRKRVDVALAESEERFRSIFEQSADGVMLADETGTVIEWNLSLERMTGLSRVSAIGKTLWDIQYSLMSAPRRAETNVETIRQRILSVLDKKNTVQFPFLREMEIERPDGVSRLIRTTLFPVKTGSNLVYYCTSCDVTEQRCSDRQGEDIEQQLLHSQKLETVGLVAGGFAYDFNNHLTTIIGNSELALLKLSTGVEGVRGELEQIERTARNASGLTRQLLTFSHRRGFEPRELDLNVVLAGIEILLKRVIGESVELRILPDADLGLVLADPGQIEQVVVTLVVNARDAMPEGGVVTIATGAMAHGDSSVPIDTIAGEYVVLSVSDTGCGMDTATKDHIFEPFFTTKEPGTGTGLGLSACRLMITRNGGNIHVDSIPGTGTTFTVFLPRIVTDSNGSAQRQITATSKKDTESVLVVEDDASVRDLMAALLRGQGYSVTCAIDGETAVTLMDKSNNFRLVITDMMMPGMNGLDLIRTLRERRPNLRAIVVSGYDGDVVSATEGWEEELVFLAKPFSSADFAKTVRMLLDDTLDDIRQ